MINLLEFIVMTESNNDTLKKQIYKIISILYIYRNNIEQKLSKLNFLIHKICHCRNNNIKSIIQFLCMLKSENTTHSLLL